MRRPHILRSVEELRVICRVFRAGGSWNVAICCGPASSLFVGSVFRYGSHWFASGVTCRPSRIVPRWHGMTYREYAAMRRYAPVRGFRYGSLWFGSPGGRGCVASRHLLRPVEEPGLIWRVFSRVPGRRIPDRLGSLSRYVSLCRAMSRRLPGRSPGRETGRPGVTSCRQGRGSSPPLPAVLDRLLEGLPA